MESERAAALAARLLARPALAGLTPLEQEQQVLLLLRRLEPETTGEARPSESGREQASRLLREELRRHTDRKLGPLLEELLRRDGSLPFAPALQSTPVDGERCREELAALLGRLLEAERARWALGAPLAAAFRDLPGRYLPHCFQRPGYVHFELAKVERLRLDPGQTASLVRAALLLRAGVFLEPGPEPPEEALTRLRGKLKSVPPAVLRCAVLSHLPCQGNPLLPASARLTAAFAAAGANATPGSSARGALAPESSWWSIAARNAGFHGLDGEMLEELRGVALRNGW